MATLPWLVRDAVGAVVSATVTGALFGWPLLALLSPARHDLADMVLEQSARSVVYEAPMAELPMERAAAMGGLTGPDLEQEASEDEGPEAAEPETEGDEGAEAHTSEGGSRSGERASEPSDDAVAEAGGAARARLHRKAPEGGDGAGDGQGTGEGDASGHAGARKGRKSRCSKDHPQIQARAERSYVVDRELVEHYTSSFERLKSLGWSGPYNEGDLRGWQISSFGCNSVLYHAGLRRGDVIQSVNGRATKNVLQVFMSWKKLRKYDTFDVVLVRKGKRMTYRYKLI